MKKISWSDEKNEKLIAERGISFDDVVYHLEQGNVLDDIEHPNQEKYPNQSILVLEINNYAYIVPYVENDTEVFLKTIIPSRKLTKQYLGDKS
ncbi:MAG: BrnT family toxin [Methylococcaceae bacterium]